MRNVRRIDATGLHALEDILKRFRSHGQHLLLSGLHEQPRRAFERAGFIEKLGPDNVCADVDVALDRARALIGEKP
jgi:SulP family sulfate permease